MPSPTYLAQAIPPFPFEPQWADRFRLTQMFRTTIREALDTTEERQEHGPRALYGIDYQVATMSAQETAWLKALLATADDLPVAMPVWPKRTRLTADYTAGGTTLTVDPTTHCMLDVFYPWALLWRNFKTWEFVRFSTVGASSVTIEAAAANWSAGDSLIPLVFGRLRRGGAFRHESDEVGSFAVEFEETFNSIAVQGVFTPVTIVTLTLPDAQQGVPYSETVDANNGFPPYAFTVVSGSLPTGLVLNEGTGIVSGTPTTTGLFSFTVRVTDLLGYTDDQAYAVDVAEPTSPTSFAGLVRWYKADTFSLADGTPVGDATNPWVDQSGSGADLTEGNAAFRPLFKQNQFNAMPGILFDGVDDRLVMSELTFGSSQGTIIIVYKHASANDGCLMGHSTLNRQVRSGRSGVNNISRYDGTFDTQSSNFSAAQTAVRCATWKGTVNSGTFWENTTQRSIWSLGTIPSPLNWIGNVSYGQPFHGPIAEIVVYNTILSDADLAVLYANYFLTRNFGLP